MKILLTNPFCWPHVRRGNERFLAELSRYLVSRGHNVTVLSTNPGPPVTVREDGVTVVRMSEIRHVGLRAVGLGPASAFAWTCRRFMREQRFDIIHCLYHSDGFAAAWTSTEHKTPYILHLTGIPVNRIPRRRPLDWMLQKIALSRAAKVVVVSQAAAAGLQTVSRVEPDIISVPCDLQTFALNPFARDLNRPVILGVGAFSERRKGVAILFRAFERVKRDLPAATLEISGDVPRARRERLLASVSPWIRNDVRFLGVGELHDLPRLYSRAALTVLPSSGEALGMSLVESLACGTPVVGGRDGGARDFVAPGAGVLFDPGSHRGEPTNVDGLVEAVRTAIGLYRNPDLAKACRDSVRHLGWDTLGLRFERLYETTRQPQRSVA